MLLAVELTLEGSLENFYFLDEIGSVQGGMTLNRALIFLFKSWGGVRRQRDRESTPVYLCYDAYMEVRGQS